MFFAVFKSTVKVFCKVLHINLYYTSYNGHCLSALNVRHHKSFPSSLGRIRESLAQRIFARLQYIVYMHKC